MSRAPLHFIVLASCVTEITLDLPDPPPDPRVTQGPTISCADPASREALGPLSREELGTEWWGGNDFGGKGINVDDFDGDGELDLFVPQSGAPTKLLLGDGAGGFVDVSPLRLPQPLDDLYGATAVDIDADGDPDLVAYGVDSRLQLLANDGSGNFDHGVLPTAQIGCGGTASFADMDLDGDLDLYHGRLSRSDGTPCDSVLFENQGGGRFVDVSERLPAPVHALKVMSSGWLQLDADPWPELYVISDEPHLHDGNLVVDNDAGELTLLPETGLELDISGMGLGVGDLNDDGVWDLVVPGIDEIAVMTSFTDRFWIDRAQSYGIIPSVEEGQSWGWGAAIEDLDHDGLLDVLVGFGVNGGPYHPGPTEQPDEIYLNRGGIFERVADAWGTADVLSERGFVLVDLDRDGWLDLVKRELGGHVVVYRSRCGEEHWLEVALELDAENLDAIGATVRVQSAAGTMIRPIEAGTVGFNSSAPPVAHFGLGAVDRVDRIEVIWPDGEVTRHPGVVSDRRLTIRYAPDEP